MAKRGGGNILTKTVNLVAWLTGVLVSLAVGFGMASEALFIPWANNLWGVTVYAGWIVIVLTIASVILAITEKI